MAANIGPQTLARKNVARRYWPANIGLQILARKFWPANFGPQKIWPADIGPQILARKNVARRYWPAKMLPAARKIAPPSNTNGIESKNLASNHMII